MNSGSSYAQIPANAESDQNIENTAYTKDACLICEYTGVAETEAYALQVLAGKEALKPAAGGYVIPDTTLPFVIHTPEKTFAEGTNNYNYAPVTIL